MKKEKDKVLVFRHFKFVDCDLKLNKKECKKNIVEHFLKNGYVPLNITHKIINDDFLKPKCQRFYFYLAYAGKKQARKIGEIRKK